MKYLQYLKIGLLLLGVIVCVLALLNNPAKGVYPSLQFALTVAYIMLILAAAASVFMPLIGILQNPQGALKSLAGLAIVAVVVGVSYAMSSTEAVTLSGGKIYDSTIGLRFTDTALFTTFFAFGAVLITIVGTEFYRIFK